MLFTYKITGRSGSVLYAESTLSHTELLDYARRTSKRTPRGMELMVDSHKVYNPKIEHAKFPDSQERYRILAPKCEYA